MHKAGERNAAASINTDKSNETNSQCSHKPFATGTSNNLLAVI